MKTRISFNQALKKGAVGFLSVLAILAIAFPVTGNVYAQEPVPWLIAFPENDAVEGWEWPEGATVYLTINNAPEGFIREGTAEVYPWGDPRTYIRFDFAGEEGYDLQVGDKVTLTDVFGTSTTHEVQPLSITGVDIDTNIVTGTANNDAFLQVWVHGQSEPPVQPTVIDGIWQADLSDVFDVTYGTGGRAWVIAEGGNATAVDWYVPNSHFTVFPAWEFFDGLDWPDGAIVTITVAGKPECTTSQESWGGFFNGNFGEGCNIEYGDEVTFSDGPTTRAHNVRTLYVTDVDMGANTVSGKAQVEAGTIVYVWPHDGWFEPLQAIVDESGNWQANLSDAGYTIREDSEGRAEIRDEMGNATAEDWHVTHPHFTVFPEWEFFDGIDWPNGAAVTITVKGNLNEEKPECETTKVSWGYFFNGNFGKGCDIGVGDVVTFTDDETIRTHTVRNLAITMVNQEDDIVTGSADPGAEVYVWPHATGEQQMVIASPKGKWNVSFAGVYDLKPGDEGRAQVQDEIGNATAVDWRVPKPRILASITEDWFYIQEFSPNTTIKFAVYKARGGKPIWKGTATTDGSGYAWINPEGRWDLVPGNYLVVKDEQNTKDLIIEGFTFDVFNLSNGQLIGTAPKPYGRNVWVGIGWENDGWSMDVTTDETGAWFADFGQPVPGDYQWVAAQIFDEDGDAIELRPSQIYPTIFAWLEWDLVDGHGWREGETVTLTINDGDHVLTQVVGTPKVVFDLQAAGHDLTVGDQITMSDGLITKQLLIPDITITDYNLGAGTISGTYDPNLGFHTYVNGQTPIDIAFDGNLWTAQFDSLGPNMWGDAIQWDTDSDAVAATIHTPNPNLYAVPDENKIFAHGWNIGFPLDLKIYDSTGNEIHSDSQMVLSPSVVPWTLVVFEGFDIEPGQRIVLSQRGYERELLVSSLVITGFDLDNHQVLGTGDPGADIFVRINGEDIWGKVDEFGNWMIAHPQLASGVWGEAIQPDGIDGDETRDGFQAP